MPQSPSVPAISVIIPVYNVADYVAACLASLKAQSWHDFEALVIDDGSTDESVQQARIAIGDDPRFILVQQANRGLSSARNSGLARARGAFIAFVDSDDRVAPDFLARLHDTIQSHEADWVACAVQSCFPDGTGQYHSAIHGAPELATHALPRRYSFDTWSDVICHFPSAWNKLYRRSLIGALTFDEGTWFEDHAFFQSLAARSDHIVHLPEPLYYQTRGRPEQITAQDDERVFEQFTVLRRLRGLLQDTVRPGADLGFAQLASRLLFERSIALKDADRRARFARQSAAFLQDQGLEYQPGWDQDIALSWGLEMAGALPVSVILPWDGRALESLEHSLRSLSAQHGPGREVLIICERATDATKARSLAQTCPGAQVLLLADAGHKAKYGSGRARTYGLAHAKGRFVHFLSAGDHLHPGALLAWCEMLLRRDGDMAVSQFHLPAAAPGQPAERQSGFLSTHPTPPTGRLELSAAEALSLAPVLSARLFRRTFLQNLQVPFTKGARSGWALMLASGLKARLCYVPWAGVDLADPGPCRGVVSLVRAHDGLIESLPQDVQQDFPQGWQRRLFARAIHHEMALAADTGRMLYAQFLARAVLAAMWRGFSGAQALPAGLDDAFGPRSCQLLDPVGGGRAALGRPRQATLYARQSGLDVAQLQPNRVARCLSFAPGKKARLQLRPNFNKTPDVNVFFYSPLGDRIPFHLSLRRDEGLAVCNDRDADGHWRQERRRAFTFARIGCEVEIRLQPPNVQVLIDGEEVFAFGARSWWHRAGMSDLATITQVGFEGDLTLTSLLPESAGAGAALYLDSRLVLRQAKAAEKPLMCQPAELALPHIASDVGIMAFLPGRVWRAVPQAASLCITQGDAQHPIFTLSRAEMAARIEALLAGDLPASDSVLVTTLLEHLRHGGLLPLLSEGARLQAQKLAAFYRLEAFLEPPELGDSALVEGRPPLVADDFLTAQTDVTIARLAQSQLAPMVEQVPMRDILASVLAIPKEARRGAFLAMSEVCFRAGQDSAACLEAARAFGLAQVYVTDDTWTRTAALPFLFDEKRFDEIAAHLDKLAAPDEGWLVTPALAWTLRQTLFGRETPGLDAALRGEILRHGLKFLSRRSRIYWDRIHCRELTRVAADMIVHRDHLPVDLQALAQRVVLRCYGLSRQFWDLLQTDGGDLPDQFNSARRAFDVVCGATDTPRRAPAEIAAALGFFAALRCVDAPRMQRELLGPAGVLADLDGRPSPAALARTPDPAMAALRHMAAPGSATLDAAAAADIPKAMRRLYPLVPAAPDSALQQRMAEQVAALLAQPQTPLEAAKFEDILAGCARLGGPEAGYIGIALGVALLTGFAPYPAQAATQRRLEEWLENLLIHPPEKITSPPEVSALREVYHDSPAQAPAVQMALLKLEGDGTAPELAARLRAQIGGTALPLNGVDNDGLPTGHPLYDTIVTVFSCKKFLDNRIPALRVGWLSLLKTMGIPYVVVVGDGDGVRRGDVLHLRAPDTYEGLPQKMLATIRWVHDTTRFTHMLKVDDDCFVNAPLFFGSLNYRKFDYYGRRLTRGPGQLDRVWHQEKSSTARGCFDLDQSPEPSDYADGGSAYAVSRTAMAAALAAARTPEGQALVQTSFMEDKLLGDLLAQRNIAVAEEDYLTAIFRRSHPEAIPVPAWQTGFNASQSAPMRMMHMDSHQGQGKALTRLAAPGLWPRKIWPSFQAPRLGYQSNALELISSEDSVKAACAAPVALVAVMRNEMFMLPRFLEHYRRLGVTAFLIADNASDDGTLEYLAAQPDVALFSVDTDYNQSRYGVAWQQALLSAFRVGKWSLVADADEFLSWQHAPRETLPELLARPEFDRAEAVRIFMLDMYPKGALETAQFIQADPFAEAGFCDRVPFLTRVPTFGPYSDQPTWTSALRHRLIPGARPNLFVAQKLALLRYQPWMRLSAGMHFIGDVKIASRELIFAHFKYNADFWRKAQTEVARRQHFNDAEEYQKYLALASEGRSVIYDRDLSLPWRESPFVAARLEF